MPSFKSLFEQKPTKSIAAGYVSEAIANAEIKKKEAFNNSVLEIVRQIDTNKEVLVGELRRFRKAEKATKTKLAAINRTVKFFHQTGNFAPLIQYIPSIAVYCRLLGVDNPTDEDKKIPEGWQPECKK